MVTQLSMASQAQYAVLIKFPLRAGHGRAIVLLDVSRLLAALFKICLQA